MGISQGVIYLLHEEDCNMKKMWVKKSNSFKSSGKFDINYYLLMSSSERLETMQFLREIVFKLKKNLKYEKSRERLRRVIKIIQ